MNIIGQIASLPEVGGLLLVAGGFIVIARVFRWIFAPSVDVVPGTDLSASNPTPHEKASH